MDLLDEVVSVYGGKDRCEQVDSIRIHQIIGGTLWTRKASRASLTARLSRSIPNINARGIGAHPRQGCRSSYRPERVVIETVDTAETPWAMLQEVRRRRTTRPITWHSTASSWPRNGAAYRRGKDNRPVGDTADIVTIEIDAVTVK